MSANLDTLDALLEGEQAKKAISSDSPQELDDINKDVADSPFEQDDEHMAHDHENAPTAPSSMHPPSTTNLPTTTSKPEKPSITVTKPIPYTFDLGNLLLSDTNPIPPSPIPAHLNTIARDCAQSLITQLLTTCPITAPPTSGPQISLPPCTTPLPREKPLPKEKEASTWEKFAKKKGIKDKKRGEGKMVYDEAKGEWAPKWGYKGRNKEGEGEWIVEVDEAREKGLKKGEEVRGVGRRERKESVKRNERRERANERRGRKGGGG